VFSIDKFSGVVSLLRPMDREEGEQYTLIISASDGAHKATTEVQVLVKDENDCAPVFDRQVTLFIFLNTGGNIESFFIQLTL
jgi:Cadherin domain